MLLLLWWLASHHLIIKKEGKNINGSQGTTTGSLLLFLRIPFVFSSPFWLVEKATVASAIPLLFAPTRRMTHFGPRKKRTRCSERTLPMKKNKDRLSNNILITNKISEMNSFRLLIYCRKNVYKVSKSFHKIKVFFISKVVPYIPCSKKIFSHRKWIDIILLIKKSSANRVH